MKLADRLIERVTGSGWPDGLLQGQDQVADS